MLSFWARQFNKGNLNLLWSGLLRGIVFWRRGVYPALFLSTGWNDSSFFKVTYRASRTWRMKSNTRLCFKLRKTAELRLFSMWKHEQSIAESRCIIEPERVSRFAAHPPIYYRDLRFYVTREEACACDKAQFIQNLYAPWHVLRSTPLTAHRTDEVGGGALGLLCRGWAEGGGGLIGLQTRSPQCPLLVAQNNNNNIPRLCAHQIGSPHARIQRRHHF